MPTSIILIHPPVAKSSEPPAGLARLSACLTENHVPNKVIDANLEGIVFLLKNASRGKISTDTWTKRAEKNLEQNLLAVKTIATYQSKSRYQRAIKDINRLLNAAGRISKVNLSLADYQDQNLSPVKSADLLAAAENPQHNPFYPYFQNRLTKALRHNPDYIGFSINFLSQALCAFAMIGFIRQINPRQKIIAGGSLITSWMKIGVNKEIFGSLIDEIVEGAGERRLLEIFNIKSGQDCSTPDYDAFPWDEYLSPGRVLPYSSARGCYWHQCAFCPEKAEGNAYLPSDVSQVANNLQKMTAQIKPVLIHLLDSSMAPSLLKALVQNPPGAPWYGFARATPILADEDFCFLLKRSGCVMLKLGLESGDQNVLDQLNKGINLLIVSRILKNLSQAGIATYCYFLFGTPPENENSALKTMDFVIQHCDDIDFLNLAIFNLPARSIEAKALTTRDFYEGDLSLYRNFKHPLGWQRPAVRNFLEKTFKRQPAIAPIVKRTPEYFTSNHAPFFVLKNRDSRDSLTTGY